jgi:hypothetical protein
LEGKTFAFLQSFGRKAGKWIVKNAQTIRFFHRQAQDDNQGIIHLYNLIL